MIRYYELPSLQTFAEEILSRTPQSSEDAIRLKITLAAPAGRPAHLPRPRGEGGRHAASVSQLGAIQSEAGKMLARKDVFGLPVGRPRPRPRRTVVNMNRLSIWRGISNKKHREERGEAVWAELNKPRRERKAFSFSFGSLTFSSSLRSFVRLRWWCCHVSAR